MPGGFVHSIKVPRLYKSAAKVVREVRENGGSLKSMIYEQRHPNTSALYSLCLNTLQKEEQLNRLLIETGILTKESRLDPWLAKIFITELLWGKKAINAECKPAQTVLKYKTELLEKLNGSSAIKALAPPNKTVRKPRYARVNTLLLPLSEAISNFVEEGWSLQSRCSNYAAHLTAVKNLTEPNFIQDFHIPELLIFPPNTTFHNHAGYQNGEIVLQDKASCFPAYLLNPEPGSVVLDMCAAPGMKSSHLAALLNNHGKVYAVEIDERRYTTLCEQVKITSASCVETLNKDALTLETEDYSNVDYILVDPTCSGSGMLDRQLVHGKEECPPHRLKQLQAFQVFLLRHALLNFPNVKRVVYSTCSINPEENEEVIDEILGNIGDAYKLVSVKNKFKNDWKNYSSPEYKCSDNCLYASSEHDLCNGFFVAVFERDFDVPLPEYTPRGGRVNKEQSQSKENGNPNDEKTGSARKRKKRGQRKKSLSMSQNSTMNTSSDSVTIIDELPNKDDSIKVYDGDETIENDDDENEDHDVSQTNGGVKENEDASPAKKIRKKRNRKSKKLSNTLKKKKN